MLLGLVNVAHTDVDQGNDRMAADGIDQQKQHLNRCYAADYRGPFRLKRRNSPTILCRDVIQRAQPADNVRNNWERAVTRRASSRSAGADAR